MRAWVLTVVAMGALGTAAAVAGESPTAGLEAQLERAGDNRAEISAFLARCNAEQGDAGLAAARFLVRSMPPRDLTTLTADRLVAEVRLALQARAEFPWCRALSEELFHGAVLPYACVDESRDPWRDELYRLCKPLVKECASSGEAAQVLNREVFNLVNVHYNRGRKKPNQSLKESQAQGRATCTGLSIILVNACRAVGVPARVVGTPLWTNKRGNHTWVEVWDGEWKYTGADEYDAKGLNRGWFTGAAAKAIPGHPEHAIFAASWAPTGRHFPLAWNLQDHSVPGIDVTARYSTVAPVSVAPSAVAVGVRVLDRRAGKRLVAEVAVLPEEGAAAQTITTKAGTADYNDLAELRLQPGRRYRLRVRWNGQERRATVQGPAAGAPTLELVWSELPPGAAAAAAEEDPAVLGRVREWLAKTPAARAGTAPADPLTSEQALAVTELIWARLGVEAAEPRMAALNAKQLTVDGKVMRWLEREFGEAPDGGRSLWISMHGGGGAPKAVNDQQWKNQIRLYKPAEGIYVAPRAPTDNWNLWHEKHIDECFDRLIACYVAHRGVNPDRVYLMGYSAGGDGVYQLAPRMADRFAAAAMMAGHPNDASPLGLRNLPFALYCGGADAAYKRNAVAAEWGKKLAALQAGDPDGYIHRVKIYPGVGHWMNLRDAESLPWMAKYARQAWPKKIVWRQSGRLHHRFYWLAQADGVAEPKQVVRAAVDGQAIALELDERTPQVTLRLSDALLDLDQPITVSVNGGAPVKHTLQRGVAEIYRSLQQRADRATVATAELTVQRP